MDGSQHNSVDWGTDESFFYNDNGLEDYLDFTGLFDPELPASEDLTLAPGLEPHEQLDSIAAPPHETQTASVDIDFSPFLDMSQTEGQETEIDHHQPLVPGANTNSHEVMGLSYVSQSLKVFGLESLLICVSITVFRHSPRWNGLHGATL